MVVKHISEFLHGSVQLFFRPEFIEVGTFVLKGVEVPPHRCIVIWVSSFAHALGHMDRFAEFYKSLRCILAPLGRCAGSRPPLPDAGNPEPSVRRGQPGRW